MSADVTKKLRLFFAFKQLFQFFDENHSMFTTQVPSYVGHLSSAAMQLGLGDVAHTERHALSPVDIKAAFNEMLASHNPGAVWHAQFSHLRFAHSLTSVPQVRAEWSTQAAIIHEKLSTNARAGIYYLIRQGVQRDILDKFLSHHSFQAHPERCNFILGMVSRLEVLGVTGVARLFRPEADNPLMLEAIAQCPIQCIAQTMIQALCISTYGVGVDSVEVKPSLSANWKNATIAVKSFAESIMAGHESELSSGYFYKNIPVASNFTVKNNGESARAVYVMTSQEAYAPDAQDERKQILKIMEVALAASQNKMSGVECVIVAPAVDPEFLSKVNYVLGLFGQPYLIRVENDEPQMIDGGLSYHVARECCFVPSPSFPLPKTTHRAASVITPRERKASLEAQAARNFSLNDAIKEYLSKITGIRNIVGNTSQAFATDCQRLGAEHRGALTQRIKECVATVTQGDVRHVLNDLVERFEEKRATERMSFEAIKDILMIATLMSEYGAGSNTRHPSTQQQSARIEDFLRENKDYIEGYVKDWLQTASEQLELSMVYNNYANASVDNFYEALVALSQSDPEVPCYDGFDGAVWSMHKIYQLIDHYDAVGWDTDSKNTLGRFIEAHKAQSVWVRSHIQEETKESISHHYHVIDVTSLPSPNWELHDAPSQVIIKTVFPFGVIAAANEAKKDGESYSDSIAKSSWRASPYLELRTLLQDMFDEANQERVSDDFDDIEADCKTSLPESLKYAALVDPTRTSSYLEDELVYAFEVNPEQIWVVNPLSLEKAMVELANGEVSEDYVKDGLKDLFLDALPYSLFKALDADEKKRRFPKVFYLIDQIKSGQLRSHS